MFRFIEVYNIENKGERKEYEYRKKNLATYNTMGIRNVIIDKELKALDHIQRELWEIAKQTEVVYGGQ